MCGEEIKFIDGKCFDMSYKANDEMGDSDGGGFNLYSKNDLGEYVEEELLKEESGGESLKK